MGKSRNTTELQSLPSIGPSLALALEDLGFGTPDDLHGQDPQRMFTDLCELRGEKIDRCVLYCFRCAVYAVTSSDGDPELAKWWNWKDQPLRFQQVAAGKWRTAPTRTGPHGGSIEIKDPGE